MGNASQRKLKTLAGILSLEALQFRECNELRHLPDNLGELPSLKQLTLWDNPRLASLPPSLEDWPSPGCWLSLEALYLHNLPLLQIPEPLLSRLRRELKVFKVTGCPLVPHD